MMKCAFPPAVGCFLLLVLGVYGLGGLVFNIRELANEDNFQQGKWPLNLRPAYISLLCAQLAIILAAILGILAAIRTVVLIYYISSFILFGVFATMAIIGGVTFRDASKDLSGLIFTSLENGEPEQFDWISHIQWEHNCCGVHSFMDWSLFKTEYMKHASVPSSCCLRDKRIPEMDCGEGVLNPGLEIKDVKKIINTEGCGAKIQEFHKSALNLLGYEMVGVGIACLLVAIYQYVAVTHTLYLDLLEDPENNETLGSGRNSSENCNTSSRGGSATGSAIRIDDENGNAQSQGSFSNPTFKPSQLSSRRRDSGVRRGVTFATASKGTIKSHTQKLKFCVQKPKTVTPPPIRPSATVSTPQNASPEIMEAARRQFLELLFDPLNKNNSTLSTTPHPSVSQNNQFGFLGKVKIDNDRSGDSKTNVRDGNTLTHHVSLPHVRAPLICTPIPTRFQRTPYAHPISIPTYRPTLSVPNPQDLIATERAIMESEIESFQPRESLLVAQSHSSVDQPGVTLRNPEDMNTFVQVQLEVEKVEEDISREMIQSTLQDSFNQMERQLQGACAINSEFDSITNSSEKEDGDLSLDEEKISSPLSDPTFIIECECGE